MHQDLRDIAIPDLLHSGQKLIYSQRRKYNYVAAGRRWRKTTMGMMMIALSNASVGRNVLWASSFYISECAVGLFKIYLQNKYVFQRSPMSVTLPSGGRIHFLDIEYLNEEKYRYFKTLDIDGVIIDEPYDISNEKFQYLNKFNWLWVFGTPPRKKDWFLEHHALAAFTPDSISWNAPLLGVEVEGEDHALSFTRATHLLENPHVSFEEVQRFGRNCSKEEFEREILGRTVI